MKLAHILLVEDNEGDIVLTKEAFEDSKIKTNFSVVKNGKDAIDFVFKTGKYTDVKRPDLILLDINIPIINGFEVLKRLKMDELSRRIPVIMFTTSSATKDINLSYDNFANSYVTKPLDMDEFMDVVLKIEDFWLELVKLPAD